MSVHKAADVIRRKLADNIGGFINHRRVIPSRMCYGAARCVSRAGEKPMMGVIVKRLFAGILIVAALGFAQIADAQSNARGTLEPWNADDRAITFDHPIEEFGGHATGVPTDTQVFWWDSFGRVRLDRQDPDSPFVGYRILTIDAGTDSRYIKSTMDELALSFGLHLGHVAGWNITTVLGAGYSGTRPFVNEKGIFGIGDLLAEHPICEQSWANTSVVVAVDYAGNAGLLPDVPLPGFAILHRDPQLNFMLGFPLNRLTWRPTEKIELTAEYSVPYSARLDFEYRIQPHFGFYATAENFFQGFVQERSDITNRQFYQMRRVEAGVRVVFDPLIDAALGVGYAFDQEFSRGFDVRNLQSFSSISNEPYIALVVRGSF
jgi:hypothetical protein